MSENYTIEVWRAVDLAHPPELLRTHTSTSDDGAEVMIESLCDSYGEREGVTWDGEEVNEQGFLAGRSAQALYTIVVKPPLKVTQS